MATIRDICDDAERIVTAITPSTEPGRAYRVLPVSLELDDIDGGASTSRQFRAMPGPVKGLGHFGCSGRHATVQTVRVAVRYLFDTVSSHRAWAMWGSDCKDIVQALTAPPAGAGWTVSHYGFRFVSADELAVGQLEAADVYLGTLDFEVSYP